MVCDKCGCEWHDGGVQNCVHEKVRDVYGKNICRYCCSKCKHNIYVACGQECELLNDKMVKRKYAIAMSIADKKSKRKKEREGEEDELMHTMLSERFEGI